MPIKVCYILPRILPGEGGVIIGGYSSNAVSLAMAMLERGVEIEILATVPKETRNCLLQHPAEKIIIPFESNGSGLVGKGLNAVWTLLGGVKKRLSKKNYDIVHGHSGIYPYAVLPMLSARSQNIIKIHSLYCPVGGKGGVYSKWVDNPSIAKYVLGKMDKVVAVTKNVQRSVQNIGIPTEKTEVIPMSVDGLRFNPSITCDGEKYFDSKETDARIVFVGNASKEKGLVQLLEAMHILVKKGLSPYLVATLENQSNIEEYSRGQEYAEKLVRELGLSNKVKFAGIVPNIEQLYAEADIVVIPWNTTKGPSDYPVVVLESISMAKCVVSTPVGGCPELLARGTAGVLAGGSSPLQLAAALETAITNPNLRLQLGQAALKVSRDFSVAKTADKMISFYEKMLEGKVVKYE